MAPRLSGQTSIFGVVFFVSKSLLGIDRQKKLEKFAILTRKPRSHVRILIYRTWPICLYPFITWVERGTLRKNWFVHSTTRLSLKKILNASECNVKL